MRGGEKVLLSLARVFPDAPLFTLLHVKGSVSPELEAREIRTTFVQNLPGVSRNYRHYLPLFPAAALSMDFRGFELVVSSSHCVVKGIDPKGAFHLSYCHTPMRYIWDRYQDYFGPGRASLPVRAAMGGLAPFLRRWDVASSRRVGHFIANSAYVAARIQRHYGREAEVLHPPVDAEFFSPGPDKEGTFDLVVSALAPYKRLELVLEAYRGTSWPVKIVGWGPEEGRLRALAPPEVSFLGNVPDEALRELYRGCRAVLMPGVEDFGIVPLEAMACGRPAVVFGEGGGLESVVEGETGLLFREPSAASLRAAVDSLKQRRFDRMALRRRAEAYRREVFEERLKAMVDKALAGASRTAC